MFPSPKQLNYGETWKISQTIWYFWKYSFEKKNLAFIFLVTKQDDDYGYEIDFGFDYRWNPNVLISGYYGYWAVGDYYAFTNSASGDKLSIEAVHGGGLRATLEF